MKVEAIFDFLGTRKYIHSTSWLYGLLNVLKDKGYICSFNEIKKINAVFRKKKHRQGYFLIDEKYDSADILFNIYTDDAKIEACYIDSGEDVMTSIPYDEDGMVKDSVINEEDKSACIIVNRIDNIYNMIVSINKKLLLYIFPKDGYTSWSVGKFSIDWSMLYRNSIGMELKTKLKNNIDDMYCRSDIYIGEKLIGNIDFARNRESI